MTEPSSLPLRIGLVGAGMISRNHLLGWQGCDRARVVAIVDFVECLRSGTPFETEARDNLRTLALVEEVYRRAG